MTLRQLEALKYLALYQSKHTVAPTVRETALALGVAPSGVHRMLKALVIQGYLRKALSGNRAYEVIKGPPVRGECPCCGQRVPSIPSNDSLSRAA